MSGYGNLDLVCEVHVNCELLPLYCTDCDCPLSGDYVTRDHFGHKFLKVSEVAETQLKQLKESFSDDNFGFTFEKITYWIAKQTIILSEQKDILLQNIVYTEVEKVEKVKLWREKMTEKIIDSADSAMKYLEYDVVLTSALVQCKDRGLD